MSRAPPDHEREIDGSGAGAGSADDGFTMIELVVTFALAVAIVGAVATLLVRGNQASLGNQRQADLVALAQGQIEQAYELEKQYGFSAVALTGTPAVGSDATLPASPTDPNDFVTNAGTASAAYMIEQNYNLTTEGTIANTPSAGEPLIVDSVNGHLAPGPASVSVRSGSATAKVYTYVTRVTAVGCNSGLGGSCTNDARRVVVAVRLDNPTGSRLVGQNTPTYTSTVFVIQNPSNQPFQ